MQNSLRVIIPACGAGKRFAEAGYPSIKPLIDVAGQPMVQHVINSFPENSCVVLMPAGSAAELGRTLLDNAKIVALRPSQYHQGAVQTILGGVEHCVWQNPVFVVNSDNVIRPQCGWENLQAFWLAEGVTAAVVLFHEEGNGPYSWAVLNKKRSVTHIAEKLKISDYACAGAFWFKSYALMHVAATMHLSGTPDIGKEYYVAPMMNHFLRFDAEVLGQVLMPSDLFVRMGVPDDLPLAEELLK
jgi:dTDP-glucose pyrophosphorylase